MSGNGHRSTDVSYSIAGDKKAIGAAAVTAGDGGHSDASNPAPPPRLAKDKKKRKVESKSKTPSRPRIAFQTRSQVDVLDDGYRWRKYGQKAVKNNKFPRSYYRCTHQGCNVKKQVQRLSKDEELVVTTYEGMHTHPTEKNNDNFEQILSQMQIYNRETINKF
ncbi:hypothetical protein HPP92_025256 [Vanilla planifolia]|uniref:WRKY domain-containing protein n=1 Tax=Vanilla planifolia TaxID=51239 RepID=A0A835PLX2_VANPL|nr:hypothetical protein HPP92_025256 [Vanilla planifolia]